MKIGCCVNMHATGPGGIGDEWLERLPAMGYDYVELPLAEMMRLEDDAFEALAKRLEALPIRCESCNNLFPPQVRITGPDVDEAAITGYLRRAFARVDRLGAEVVVYGSVGAKNVPEGYPRDAAYRQIVRSLELIEQCAAPYRFQVVIEPVNQLESNIILTLEEGLTLREQAPLPHIACLVDYYHMRLEEESPRMILRAGELLRHTHIACPRGRGLPLPEDGEDYRPLFRALREAGYRGRMSIEAKSTQFGEDSVRSLAYLRRLIQNTADRDAACETQEPLS